MECVRGEICFDTYLARRARGHGIGVAADALVCLCCFGVSGVLHQERGGVASSLMPASLLSYSSTSFQTETPSASEYFMMRFWRTSEKRRYLRPINKGKKAKAKGKKVRGRCIVDGTSSKGPGPPGRGMQDRQGKTTTQQRTHAPAVVLAPDGPLEHRRQHGEDLCFESLVGQWAWSGGRTRDGRIGSPAGWRWPTGPSIKPKSNQPRTNRPTRFSFTSFSTSSFASGATSLPRAAASTATIWPNASAPAAVAAAAAAGAAWACACRRSSRLLWSGLVWHVIHSGCVLLRV